MTNIIQVQNRLKSVPDETLISEIQKPTGQAPQFLVLNELNRRKNDRAEYARLQEEGPQTTVAEDIVKPPAPPAGIGALRPPHGPSGRWSSDGNGFPHAHSPSGYNTGTRGDAGTAHTHEQGRTDTAV